MSTPHAAPYEVVVPTVGRASLDRMLRALATCAGPRPARVIVVADRPRVEVEPRTAAAVGAPLRVVRGLGRGPASARNIGWRLARSEWVAFLDDDVVPSARWAEDLASDLDSLGPEMAGTQGRIRVPLPAGRRPTDWERNVRGLETARWATADMAYRRDALADVGGFDERFARAYREDADLALRLEERGWLLARGSRLVDHPPGPSEWSASVSLQAGNADDVLMGAVHGRGWRERAGAPRGRLRRHVAITACAAFAGAAFLARRPAGAFAGVAGWALGTAELVWTRILPGPRTAREVGTMLGTSLAIPPVATAWWLAGWLRLPRLLARGGPRRASTERPRAVLFDRDGTLVADVPYNGDPSLVRPVPGAREAVDRLRASGIRLGIVSNQSGVGRGLITGDQVRVVNERIQGLLGPFDVVAVCPHAPVEGCVCRKPSPGLVVRAAEALGLDPTECAVIGDTAADVEAAVGAGARPVLVPNPVTRRDEILAAPEVAMDLASAVELLVNPQWERSALQPAFAGAAS